MTSDLPSEAELELLLSRMSEAAPGPDPSLYDGVDLSEVVAWEATGALRQSFTAALKRVSDARGVTVVRTREKESLFLGALVLHVLEHRDDGLSSSQLAVELRRYRDGEVPESTLQRVLADLTRRGLIRHENDRGRASQFCAIRG